MTEGSFVRGPQDYARRLTRLKCFLLAWCTKAPTIAGPQAAKTEFRSRCRKVIATRSRELKKCGSHDGADRVTTDILLPGFAATVSEKPRHRLDRAGFKSFPEYIAGIATVAPIALAFVPHSLVSIATVTPHIGTPFDVSPDVANG